MTKETRPRTSTSSSRPGSAVSQKMQSVVRRRSRRSRTRVSRGPRGVPSEQAGGWGWSLAASAGLTSAPVPSDLSSDRHRVGRNRRRPAGCAGAAGSLLISSLSSLPGLKYGTFFGGTSTLSPVFGLRPLRGSRLRSRKLPNPRSSIFSPRCSASMMLRNTVSTMTSECFLVRSDTRDTSSTSSAFVMLPLVIRDPSWLMADG